MSAEPGKDGLFELRTTRRPQAVLLDPDKQCHRLVPNGAPGDRVFFQGGEMRDLLRSFRLSLGLLLGRRLLLFAVIDVVVVGWLVLAMLLESDGDAARDLYRYAFLVPSLILGLPALAGMVDLERRAGCLDLALSAPAAEAYFVRRAGAVCAVVAAQGVIVMARLARPRQPFPASRRWSRSW